VNFEDILLKEDLDKLAREHPQRFKVYYVLNNPPAGWTGGVGFVSQEQIEQHLAAPKDSTKILMCGMYSFGSPVLALARYLIPFRPLRKGPPPMMTAMKKHLSVLKYQEPRTISKLDDQVFLF
jgi:cytochrome-b5 reductase